jgi:hypothetical protein
MARPSAHRPAPSGTGSASHRASCPRPMFVQLVDHVVDRIDDRDRARPRCPKAASTLASAPPPSLSKASKVRSTTWRGLPCHRGLPTPASAIVAQIVLARCRASAFCRPAAEPKWCSRLAWVRPIRGNGLQRDRLRPSLDQQRRAASSAAVRLSSCDRRFLIDIMCKLTISIPRHERATPLHVNTGFRHSLDSLTLPPPKPCEITCATCAFAAKREAPPLVAGGDPVATAWFNALSATFPRGEAFFIESVKAHRDGRAAAGCRGYPRLHHPGSEPHPRTRRLQPAAADAGYDIAASRRACRDDRNDQGPPADRQPCRDDGARTLTPR